MFFLCVCMQCHTDYIGELNEYKNATHVILTRLNVVKGVTAFTVNIYVCRIMRLKSFPMRLLGKTKRT